MYSFWIFLAGVFLLAHSTHVFVAGFLAGVFLLAHSIYVFVAGFLAGVFSLAHFRDVLDTRVLPFDYPCKGP